MPPRPCLDCGTLVHASRCDPCKRAKQREREANRPSPRERGYGYAWTKARAAHLELEPACRSCGTTGEPGNPLTVDHIIPKSSGGGDEEENLRTLCRRCHGSRSGRQRTEGRGR